MSINGIPLRNTRKIPKEYLLALEQTSSVRWQTNK